MLADLDARYDSLLRMPWCHASGPGYHTLVPAGSRVHQTKEAADYAIALLQDGAGAHVARAHEVLDALISLQVTDPVVGHYGLWGWFAEEPPERMSPADWNWADFIGVRLAHILVAHGKLLQPGLHGRVREALRNAALSIFRRNVGADYTNIAVMGAVTTAAAGEILCDELLTGYATQRLAAVVALRQRIGGFTEYNSPSYHRVVLEELERAMLIVENGQFRQLADELRELTWASLAERFHPGTGQLAGPISRAYDDRLSPGLAAYLTGSGGNENSLVPSLPCPAALSARFQTLPSAPLELRTRFSDDVTGTTWMTEDACLGSADEEFAWVQRRPLLGYWRTAEDPAVVLRARMLLNGHDLSAAWCRNTQQGSKVLSAWWLSYDSGDFHPALDKPEGSIFHVTDLRLVVSLRGNGVQALPLGGGAFTLAAGERKAVVHTIPAVLRGLTIDWTLSNADGEACVEAVLHRGPAQDLDFHEATLRAGFALELLTDSEQPTSSALEVSDDFHWRWGDLTVTSPVKPTPFAYSREQS